MPTVQPWTDIKSLYVTFAEHPSVERYPNIHTNLQAAFASTFDDIDIDTLFVDKERSAIKTGTEPIDYLRHRVVEKISKITGHAERMKHFIRKSTLLYIYSIGTGVLTQEILLRLNDGARLQRAFEKARAAGNSEVTLQINIATWPFKPTNDFKCIDTKLFIPVPSPGSNKRTTLTLPVQAEQNQPTKLQIPVESTSDLLVDLEVSPEATVVTDSDSDGPPDSSPSAPPDNPFYSTGLSLSIQETYPVLHDQHPIPINAINANEMLDTDEPYSFEPDNPDPAFDRDNPAIQAFLEHISSCSYPGWELKVTEKEDSSTQVGSSKQDIERDLEEYSEDSSIEEELYPESDEDDSETATNAVASDVEYEFEITLEDDQFDDNASITPWDQSDLEYDEETSFDGDG